MADTFSTDIDVLGLHRVVVQGTVDDPGNVANVEVFRGTRDVGSAHVSANGTWRLTVAPSTTSAGEPLSAVVTDGADNNVTIDAGFALLASPPFAVGNLVEIEFTNNPISLIIFSSDGNLIINATEQIDSNNKTIFSETGNGASVPFFCFTADQAGAVGSFATEISNFHVAKASHDFLDFSNGPFSTIAQVLRHTSTFQGNTTIHLDQNSTVKLDGVTRAQLMQHHDVFFFG